MPLPTSPDQVWPPTTVKPIIDEATRAKAWWSGDHTALASAAASRRDQRPGHRLWERSIPADQPDTRVHVPLAADIAQTGADLLFSEDITWTSEGEAATALVDRLTTISDDTGLGATLLEAAELAGAMGGIFLRPTWDTAVSDLPFLSTVNADRAAPKFRYGQLAAVAFWRELAIESRTGSQAVWRHVELHEPGRIFHGLYKGTTTHLGTRSDLRSHPDTAMLVDEVNLETLLGWGGLLAAYVPNVRPHRRLTETAAGRADTSGLEGLMDSLDLTMTSWARDLRLGRARLIVPDQFLTRSSRGGGAHFDEDREVFSPLDIDPANAKEAGITPVEFKIRTEEHAASALDLTERIIRGAGYSPRSLGIGAASGASTATEVRSDETASLHTNGRKQRYWRPGLAHIGHALLAIDRGVFNRPTTVDRPGVAFGEPIGADIREIASTLNLINLAKAASLQTRVQLLHADWTDEQVQAEVDRIKAEEGVVADPTGGFV